MDGSEVRRARVGEGRAIAEMKRRSWQAAYAGLLPDDVLANLDLHPPPQFHDEASADGRGPLVALLDGTVVGTAAFGMARDEDLPDRTGELFMIYLDPAVWGRGLGHALHEEAVAGLRTLGVDRSVLWVLEGNEQAIGFYRAHGWRPDGTTRVEPVGEVDLTAVRFARDL